MVALTMLEQARVPGQHPPASSISSSRGSPPIPNPSTIKSTGQPCWAFKLEHQHDYDRECEALRLLGLQVSRT